MSSASVDVKYNLKTLSVNLAGNNEKNTGWSKVSVHLTVTVQSSVAQRRFDHPIIIIIVVVVVVIEVINIVYWIQTYELKMWVTSKKKDKGHPCTGTEALHRPYGL